jgi:hypothetical protein
MSDEFVTFWTKPSSELNVELMKCDLPGKEPKRSRSQRSRLMINSEAFMMSDVNYKLKNGDWSSQRHWLEVDCRNFLPEIKSVARVTSSSQFHKSFIHSDPIGLNDKKKKKKLNNRFKIKAANPIRRKCNVQSIADDGNLVSAKRRSRSKCTYSNSNKTLTHTHTYTNTKSVKLLSRSGYGHEANAHQTTSRNAIGEKVVGWSSCDKRERESLDGVQTARRTESEWWSWIPRDNWQHSTAQTTEAAGVERFFIPHPYPWRYFSLPSLPFHPLGLRTI